VILPQGGSRWRDHELREEVAKWAETAQVLVCPHDCAYMGTCMSDVGCAHLPTCDKRSFRTCVLSRANAKAHAHQHAG